MLDYLVDAYNALKEVYDANVGFMSVEPMIGHVHLTVEGFKRLFKEYEVGQMEFHPEYTIFSAIYKGVKFIAIKEPEQ